MMKFCMAIAPIISAIRIFKRSRKSFPKVIKVMLRQADKAAIENARQEANLHACLYKPRAKEELTQIVISAIN